MSVERCFVDTNVLIYLFDDDSPGKQSRAQALFDEERERIVLSTQVLGEFYVNVTRKLEEPLTPDAAAQALENFLQFEVQSVTAELVLLGRAPQPVNALVVLGLIDRGDGTTCRG